MRGYILYEVQIIFFYCCICQHTINCLTGYVWAMWTFFGLSCTLIFVTYTYESLALLHQVSNELFIYFFPSLQRVVRHNLPIGRYVLNYFVFWSVASDKDGYIFWLLSLFTNFTKILDLT